jgi:hypothetical protein
MFSFLHAGHEKLYPDKRTPGGDFILPVHLVDSGLKHRRRHGHNHGVIDEDIYLSECIESLLSHVFHGSFTGNISLHEEGGAGLVLAIDKFFSGFPGFHRNIGDDHFSAEPCQAPGHAQPYIPRAAGNYRHLAGKRTFLQFRLVH